MEHMKNAVAPGGQETSEKLSRRKFMQKMLTGFLALSIGPSAWSSSVENSPETPARRYLSPEATPEEIVEYLQNYAEQPNYKELWEDETRMLLVGDIHGSTVIQQELVKILQDSREYATDFALEMIPAVAQTQIENHLQGVTETATDSLITHLKRFEHGTEGGAEDLLRVLKRANDLGYTIHAVDVDRISFEQFMKEQYNLEPNAYQGTDLVSQYREFYEKHPVYFDSEYPPDIVTRRNKEWADTLRDVLQNPKKNLIVFAGVGHFGDSRWPEEPTFNTFASRPPWNRSLPNKNEQRTVRFLTSPLPEDGILLKYNKETRPLKPVHQHIFLHNKLYAAAEKLGMLDASFIVWIDPAETSSSMRGDVFVHAPDD